MAISKTFINFALLGLFVFSFISFMSVTQTNNDVTDNILSNTILNKTYSSLDANLSSFKTTAQSQDQTQDVENPTAQSGSLIFFGITKTGSVVKGMIFGVYNAVILLPATILGIPEIAIAIISAIIIITLILSAWRLYKAGE